MCGVAEEGNGQEVVMTPKSLDRSVTLELPVNDPKVKTELQKIGRSMEKWRDKLEKGRRRARALFDEERRKKGFEKARKESGMKQEKLIP